MFLVKKYDNRKLYLPATVIQDQKVSGRYITSKQLLELEKHSGVKVIDNKTKENITDETILSAVFELAKAEPQAKKIVLSSLGQLGAVLEAPSFLTESITDTVKILGSLKDTLSAVSDRLDESLPDIDIPTEVFIPKTITKSSDDFSGF